MLAFSSCTKTIGLVQEDLYKIAYLNEKMHEF